MVRIHMLKTAVCVTLAAVSLIGSAGCAEKPEIITESSGEAESRSETAESEKAAGGDVYVYVTGRVKKPDVYKVSEGSRVYQLIDMAGGFEEDADTVGINLADRVYDGMKLVVYAVGEVHEPESTFVSEKEDVININTASKEQLMTLPGIGESKAESIIRYREETGRFNSIEDIMNISGIKEGAYNKIKELITV